MISLRELLVFLCFVPALAMAQEVCNNGVDDDADGLIDLNDTVDCPCSTALIGENVASYIRNHSFEDQMCCPFGFVSAVSPPWLSCASAWQQATEATSDYFHECGYSPGGFPLPPPDGEGAVGFYAGPGYFEYVGTCLTFPEPANPLLAGVTYTLSFWVAAAVSVGNHEQPLSQADPSYFTDQMPMALFGHANECVAFPVSGVSDCIGFEPDWIELGRVMVQPALEWTRVFITFTPVEEIHTIMLGGGCDVPDSYAGLTITNSLGETYYGRPYFLLDDLMLTEAGDQVLTPVSTTGTLCAENAAVTALPPASATDYQWYQDGVALPGQTSATLDVSQLGLEGGLYTFASSFNGACLMGASSVGPALYPDPLPFIDPSQGCAPLLVSFADTTTGATTVEWSLGDGTGRADSAFTHTYPAPGSYDVRLTVRNAAGCSNDTLLENAVVVYPSVNGALSASPNPAEVGSPVVELTGAASGEVLTWWWDLGAVPPGTVEGQSLSVTFPAVAGDYPVLLVVTTAGGCVDTVRSVVRIIEPGVIEMPNVFSPNGDGRNDRFTPLDYNGTPGLLEIYNRWGQQVFSTRALAQGWSGADVPDGTYYYVVTPDDEKTEAFTGHVTLVR